MIDIFYIVYFIWNMFVFFLMGLDKYKAKHHLYRISEATLLGCAALFGGFGGCLGMVCFHHKTKKRKFQILMPLAFVLQLSFYLLVIID